MQLHAVRAVPLAFLFEAFGRDGACFTLGSGASAPDVPLLSQLRFQLGARGVDLAGWFPAGKIPPTPMGQLIASLGPPRNLWEWKVGMLTPATVGFLLGQRLAAVRWCPPQYRVFRTFTSDASVVSFNWDGLADDWCPQTVIQPHGRSRARLLSRHEVQETLFWTQDMIDGDDLRRFLVGDVILPGEEEARAEDILPAACVAWRSCSLVVAIGYSFGLRGAYDQLWRDWFVDCMRWNPVPIHVVDPAADVITGELCERIKRRLNVYAWPFQWKQLAIALLRTMRLRRLRWAVELLSHPADVLRAYDRAMHDS